MPTIEDQAEQLKLIIEEISVIDDNLLLNFDISQVLEFMVKFENGIKIALEILKEDHGNQVAIISLEAINSKQSILQSKLSEFFARLCHLRFNQLKIINPDEAYNLRMEVHQVHQSRIRDLEKFYEMRNDFERMMHSTREEIAQIDNINNLLGDMP